MNILIVGAGLVGSTLAEKLARDEHDVTLVERSAANVRRLSEALDAQVVEGNGATARVLRRAGVERSNLVVATTNSDEANMVVGLLATSLFRVPRVVVRLRDPDHAEGFEILSESNPKAYVRINPEAAAVDRLFNLLQVPGAADVVPFLQDRLVIAGFRIKPDSDFAGLTLGHVSLMFPATPMLVVAIQRKDAWIIPGGEEEIRPGDLIYFAIARDELDNVLSLIGAEKRDQRVMIGGAGRIGIALAHRLEKAGVRVRLIEEDHDRAVQAAEELGATAVAHGQVTDHQLLEEEDIELTGTFAALTHDHEVNLVSSLLAKRLGARRAFALVDNPALVHLIGDVGIDAVISPRSLAVSLILQNIRRGRVRHVASLLEDQVEVMEVEAAQGGRLTSGPLSDVKLPRGVLVAAVLRDERLLVPVGGDRVEAGDRVLLITTTDKATDLDEYLTK